MQERACACIPVSGTRDPADVGKACRARARSYTAGLRGCRHTADNERLTHPCSSSEYSEHTAMTIVRMTDLDLSGQRVLIRQGEPV